MHMRKFHVITFNWWERRVSGAVRVSPRSTMLGILSILLAVISSASAQSDGGGQATSLATACVNSSTAVVVARWSDGLCATAVAARFFLPASGQCEHVPLHGVYARAMVRARFPTQVRVIQYDGVNCSAPIRSNHIFESGLCGATTAYTPGEMATITPCTAAGTDDTAAGTTASPEGGAAGITPSPTGAPHCRPRHRCISEQSPTAMQVFPTTSVAPTPAPTTGPSELVRHGFATISTTVAADVGAGQSDDGAPGLSSTVTYSFLV